MSTFIGTDRVVAVEDNNTVVLVVGRAVEHMVDLDMLEVGSPVVAEDNSSVVAGIVAAVLGIVVDTEDVVGGTDIAAVVAGIVWVAVYMVLPEWQQTLVVQVHDRAVAGWQQIPAAQVHDRVVAGWQQTPVVQAHDRVAAEWLLVDDKAAVELPVAEQLSV